MSIYRKFIATVFISGLLASGAIAQQSDTTKKPGDSQQPEKLKTLKDGVQPTPSKKPKAAEQSQGDGKAAKSSESLSKKQIQELAKKKSTPPSGTSLYIEPIGNPRMQYSVLITDASNHSLPGIYTVAQVDIFEALMLAARDFALNAEEVGTPAQPKTMRFMDKHDDSFIIDVQKAGNESRFFVTMSYEKAQLIVDAGVIKRDGKGDLPEPLFYKMITKVQTAKTIVPEGVPIPQ